MKRKLFKALKKRLHEKGFASYREIAEVLGWSRSTLILKMAGYNKWNTTDSYELMNLIEEPLYKLPYYFPPEDMGLVLDVTYGIDEEMETLDNIESQGAIITETMWDRIKKLRKSLGISQAELAQHLGYTSRTSISKIENSCIDLSQSKILKIAEILQTTPAYLIGEESALKVKEMKLKQLAELIQDRLEEFKEVV